MKIRRRPKPSRLFMRNLADRFGLYGLFLLLILNPFHFIISKHFLYYREILACLFAILWLSKVINWKRVYGNLNKVRPEVFFVVLFPLLLLLFVMVDPGKDLYHSDILKTSLILETVPPSLYVLRNACIYIPMVLYFALRGLTEGEVRWIALISVLVAPFSVIVFLMSSELATLQTLGSIVQLGGYGLSYITYVPYLTFPVLSSIYLIASDSGKFLKMVSFGVLISLLIYIVVSTSRQSVLFVLICGLIFFLFNKDITVLKKIVIGVLTIAVAVMAFNLFFENYEAHERIIEHFTSVSCFTSGGRLEIAKRGLNLLEPHEHFIGAGLTSVIGPGPHNDYVRWWQRVGFFAMVLGFMPFILAARKAYTNMRFSKYDALSIYVFLTTCFTLYYSFFGFPREDAFQAPYCFLGLAIALGIEQARRVNRMFLQC
jgi:hypothetical protein